MNSLAKPKSKQDADLDPNCQPGPDTIRTESAILNGNYTDIENEEERTELQITKEVYDELKTINRDQLIQILKTEDIYSKDKKPDWLDNNGVFNQEEKRKHAEELKSSYTMSAIDACNSFKFILLLLKNYSRGSENVEIIELIVQKISDQF